MSRRKRKNVGIIGLGIIGSRVADILRQKGFHVFVWNRTPRPVPNFVGAPAELAEMCDIVQLFVSDDDALLQMVEEVAPALGPRHIVLAHSTVSPHSIQRAAQIVERRGARFIEAPFTGSKTGAEKGELVYYVAGDEAALREVRPILEASGKEIMVIGEIGQATVIKIATNMVTAASVQAAAEALALVRAVGLPMEKFIEAMRGNASNSTTLAFKLPKIIAANFEPHFSMKHMLKDVQIASRLGLSNQLELGVTAAARDRLLEQMQRGFGEDDYSAVARKYFADTKPTSGAEANLELFEQPPAPETVQPHEEVPESSQPESFVPMMPEIGAQEPESSGAAAASGPEPTQAASVSEDAIPASVSEEPVPATASEESTSAPVSEEPRPPLAPEELTSASVSEEPTPAPAPEEATPALISEEPTLGPAPVSEELIPHLPAEESKLESTPPDSISGPVSEDTISAPPPEEPTHVPVSEQPAIAPVSEEARPQESAAGADIDETRPVGSDEDVREDRSPRSLLDRLLKRGAS